MTHYEPIQSKLARSKPCNILTSLEGIQMDGRRFALYDNEFVVSDTLKIDLQFCTTQTEGLLIWHKDNPSHNAIVVELERDQITTRIVCKRDVYSARSRFKQGYLSNGNWHCLNIRICANHIEMSVDNRDFRRTQAGIFTLSLKGPLFLCGRPESLVPDYVAVRSKEFWMGGIRELRINNIHVNWLPQSLGLSAASPELKSIIARRPLVSNIQLNG